MREVLPRMKILIVEDDASSLLYLCETCKSQGYDVRTAENGKTGFDAFREFAPDLVLSDIKMPVMDGLEMLEQIRRQNSDVIVVMTTAFGLEEYTIKALRLKANDYLRKPVRHEQLLPLLRKYAAVVSNRTIEQEIVGMIEFRQFRMTFDNRLSLVNRIVDRLVQETGAALPHKQRLGVHLGLVEILSNAIEHGNLGISYEEKTQALESEAGLERLYQERALDPRRGNRRVTVEFSMTPDAAEWIISDQGEGFDWRTMPDPLADENLLEAHGRGILLARMQFNEFEFRGSGNTVRLKKSFREPEA